MNLFVTVPDAGCLLECFGAFMREPGNRPTLDDIFGAACELYRIDPDDLYAVGAIRAIRAYCYLAVKWAGEPYSAIGARAEIDALKVNKLSRSVMILRRQDMVLRDDLDLLAVRVAERFWLGTRWKQFRTTVVKGAERVDAAGAEIIERHVKYLYGLPEWETRAMQDVVKVEKMIGETLTRIVKARQDMEQKQRVG